jgi:hypothetical protein
MEKRQRTTSQPVKSGIARLLQYAVLRYVIFIATKPELSSSRPLPNAINHFFVPPNWAMIPAKKGSSGVISYMIAFSLVYTLHARIPREKKDTNLELASTGSPRSPGVPVPLIFADGGGRWGCGTEDEYPQDL